MELKQIYKIAEELQDNFSEQKFNDLTYIMDSSGIKWEYALDYDNCDDHGNPIMFGIEIEGETFKFDFHADCIYNLKEELFYEMLQLEQLSQVKTYDGVDYFEQANGFFKALEILGIGKQYVKWSKGADKLI